MTMAMCLSLRAVYAFLLSVACVLTLDVWAAPCSSATGQPTVNGEATALTFAEAVNCSDGQFNVEWIGTVQVPIVIEIPTGTVINIYGSGSSPTVVEGARVSQLFWVLSGEPNLDNVTLAGGKSYDMFMGGGTI